MNSQFSEKLNGQTQVMASQAKNAAIAESIVMHGHYDVTCHGPREELRDVYNELRAKLERLTDNAKIITDVFLNRQIEQIKAEMAAMIEPKWSDTIENLIPTEGKNYILDEAFAGSAYTAAMYLFLVDGASTPTYAAGDTMASHSGWSENTAYSSPSNRATCVFSAAASGAKALSSALSFTMNAGYTLAGAGISTNSTKSGTTGTLISAGSYTGGNKSGGSGDTINVSWSVSV